MNSEDRRFTICFIAVVTAIMLTIIGCTVVYNWKVLTALKLGYQETLMPGRAYPVWQQVPHPEHVPAH